MPEVIPFQVIRGHPGNVRGVVHLADEERRIITCSNDGSLRLWDLKSGKQIGKDWRDGVDKPSMCTMTLSPNGSTVASGSGRTVRLWDVRTGKVIVRWNLGHTDWMGHPNWVQSVCWSGDGKRVACGYSDGTARVWDVKSSRIVLGPITTGHRYVSVVIYSPDSTKFATGGDSTTTSGVQDGVRIWDAKTGKLLKIIQYWPWGSFPKLAWTSDGKKLICTSAGPISIFDTATWNQIVTPGISGMRSQKIAYAISLSQNDRLLVSTSGAACLWNLDTNLPIGPPLYDQHNVGSSVLCAAFSADGKVLVTATDHSVYAWDIQAILKNAGLKDLLLPIPRVAAAKSPINSNATPTRRPPSPIRRIPPRFFDDMPGDIHSSTSRSVHHPSSHRILAPSIGSPRALLARIPALFHRPHSHTNEATELQQIQRRGIFSRRGPCIVEVAAVQDRKSLVVAPRPKETQPQSSRLHGQGSSSQSQSQPTATSTSTTQPALNSSTQATTPGVPTIRSRLLTLLARLVLLICCAPLPSTDGH